jgi:hypothetical protein
VAEPAVHAALEAVRTRSAVSLTDPIRQRFMVPHQSLNTVIRSVPIAWDNAVNPK